MFDLGPYAGFILSSYGLSFLVVLALLIWIRLDKRTLEKDLADLAAQGYGRGRTASGQAQNESTK